MKLVGSRSKGDVIDAWLASIVTEFGNGWHSSTAERVLPIVGEMIESPTRMSTSVIEFGHRHGAAQHTLDFTIRCLELLTWACDDELAAQLNTRDVAVLLTEGWNSGSLGHHHRSVDQLTPMPVFLHLLKQRYVSADSASDRISRRVVLVVVDLREIVTSRIEFESLRASAIGTLRSVWTAGEPISEGAHGTFVVMAERDHDLHATVGRLRRLMLIDSAVQSNRAHVWIEPLSDVGLHLESHLESLVGHTEPRFEPIAQLV